MDIQELKSIWTKIVDDEGAKYQLDQKAMEQLVTKKSNYLLERIQKELNLKRWASGIIGTLTIIVSFVYLLIDSDQEFLFSGIITREEMCIITFLMGLIIIGLFFTVRSSYKEIGLLQKSSENLKRTLQKTSAILKRIMRFGIYSDTFGVPFFAGWLLYRRLFGEDSFTIDIRWLYILITIIVTGVLTFHLNKFFKHKKFGPYLNSIQNCIDDLDYMKEESTESTESAD